MNAKTPRAKLAGSLLFLPLSASIETGNPHSIFKEKKMSNDGFLKAAEEVTMEKLYNLASTMMKAEEMVAGLVDSYTSLKQNDSLLRSYLLQKAEIARLGREVDEVIRNHEILCHNCGEPHKLRRVAPLGVLPRVILRCPHGGALGSDEYISDTEAKSLERILRFAQVDKREIFDTKVP